MKLVARRDFANVPKLGLKLTDGTKGFVHAGHVHKGHRFEVGTSDIFEDLKVEDQATVAQLIGSRCAVYDVDANKAVLAKIDAEVSEAARQSKSVNAAPSMAELIASAVSGAVAKALADAGVIKPAAPTGK
jgi:hypothetical protein